MDRNLIKAGEILFSRRICQSGHIERKCLYSSAISMVFNSKKKKKKKKDYCKVLFIYLFLSLFISLFIYSNIIIYYFEEDLDCW